MKIFEYTDNRIVIIDSNSGQNCGSLCNLTPKRGIIKGKPLFIVYVKDYGKCAVCPSLCSNIVIAITSPASEFTTT